MRCFITAQLDRLLERARWYPRPGQVDHGPAAELGLPSTSGCSSAPTSAVYATLTEGSTTTSR
jgi:hypothetical protein